ncbi:putative PEPTIDE SYNTHETASE NRP domain protein [Mycobacterium xenopi 3993]|nr:putative PEPTIDE SYNTHETASE NRP domain protein [Mycobacterium xenopi 3993]
MGNRVVLTRPVVPVSVPELFAAQVARSPQAVALSCGDVCMTYRELDEAANRLAHLLVGYGPARASTWDCCFADPLRRSWRWWRCSKAVRRIWR